LTGVWVLLVLALVLGFGFWVYRDAARRGSSHPFGWAVASVAGFHVMVLLYPFLRKWIGPQTEPSTRIERAMLAAISGILLAFVIGALVSPPDPFAQIVFASGAVFVTIPVAYALVGLHERRTAAN
jgi:sec-independent protein translocase protein TatC